MRRQRGNRDDSRNSGAGSLEVFDSGMHTSGLEQESPGLASVWRIGSLRPAVAISFAGRAKAGCPGSPRGERSNEPNERAAAIRAVLSASLLTAERGRRIGAQHAAAGHDGRHNPHESHKQWGDEQCDGVAWSDSVQL
jgi:hypothetical protein